MRFIFKLILWLIILLPVAVLTALYFAVERAPRVETQVKLTPAQVDRAKNLFDQHDPRDLQDGEVKTIRITKRDLDLAVNYLVHLVGQGGSVIDLGDGFITIQATAHLPKNPVGHYLNVDIDLIETSGIPKVDHLRFGQLSVPNWLANQTLKLAMAAFYDKTGQRLESGLVHKVKMTDKDVSITYQWEAELADVVRDSLVSVEDQTRLEVYHRHLVDTVSGGVGSVRMVDILQSLLQLAEDRSDNNDAVSENRAAIIVLTAYVDNHGLKRLAPQADTWPIAPKREVRLLGRRDFAQHFMLSASLSMVGGNVFSDAVGLLKEVDDARGGSGFSFNDLCADKAGTRFGERATTYSRAGEIQSRATRNLSESDIMPRVDDLPEHMDEAEFKRRFGGVDGLRYKKMIAEIDRRVDQLPLYR